MHPHAYKKQFAQRCHSPQYIKDPFLHGPLIVRQPFSADSVVLGERGKKNFPPQTSTPEEFHSSKRLIPRKEYGEEFVNRGKKFIPHSDKGNGRELSHAERVHFDLSQVQTEDFGKLPCSTWTKKRVVKTPNGVPVALKESNNWDIEYTMNRKQRINSSQGRRNLIPEATKGDKYYKEADREPGFYERGGLVVGSTNTLKPSAKPTLRKSEGIPTTSGVGKKIVATYGKLQAKLTKEFDLKQVHHLTKSSKDFQGEFVPSWEEKTGNFLIDPDEESIY